MAGAADWHARYNHDCEPLRVPDSDSIFSALFFNTITRPRKNLRRFRKHKPVLEMFGELSERVKPNMPPELKLAITNLRDGMNACFVEYWEGSESWEKVPELVLKCNFVYIFLAVVVPAVGVSVYTLDKFEEEGGRHLNVLLIGLSIVSLANVVWIIVFIFVGTVLEQYWVCLERLFLATGCGYESSSKTPAPRVDLHRSPQEVLDGLACLVHRAVTTRAAAQDKLVKLLTQILISAGTLVTIAMSDHTGIVRLSMIWVNVAFAFAFQYAFWLYIDRVPFEASAAAAYYILFYRELVFDLAEHLLEGTTPEWGRGGGAAAASVPVRPRLPSNTDRSHVSILNPMAAEP
mmetsp:Transcript_15276/g.50186  ORF Transcript_15276/g.50186 Transcript_15276/m.50186 type:complete len:348 (-) Transcript_15276:3-1046(-)